MGASGSVGINHNLTSNQIGDYIVTLGKEFEPYRHMVIEKRVTGEQLLRLHNQHDITDFMKHLGVKNNNHQKALGNHLLKLIETVNHHHQNQNHNARHSSTAPKGVQLSIILEFVKECGGERALRGMTTANVVERFVKPKTMRMHSAYTDMLKTQNHGGVGPATIYISHSWEYVFMDVIDSLECFAGESNPVVWMDIFCSNQHTPRETNFQTLRSSIESTITTIGHTLCVMLPWQTPLTLTRAWCLYDVHVTVTHNLKLELTMSDEQESGFVDAVITDIDAFDIIMASVDLSTCVAAPVEHKTALVTLLTPHIAQLTAAVFAQLREFSCLVLKAAMDSELNEDAKLDWKMSYAGLLRRIGRFTEAEPLLQQCLTKLQRDCGEDNPDTLAAMHNLASIYESQGNYATAEPLLVKCMEISRRVLGAENPTTLAAMNGVADVYSMQAKYFQAEPLYLECLQVSERVLGKTNADTLTTMNNLAYMYVSQQKYAQAEPLLVECLQIRTQELGDDNVETLASVHNLAYLFKSQGKFEEAEAKYRDCLNLVRIKLGDTHPSTLSTMNNMASLLRVQGRNAESETLYIECMGKYKATLGPDHPSTLTCINGLAALYDAMGQLEKAEPLFLESVEKGKALLGASHPSVREWRSNYEVFLTNKAKTSVQALNPKTPRTPKTPRVKKSVTGEDPVPGEAQHFVF